MDQKKTLWIIAAVGAFLLVVLGAALIMYAPANRQPTAVASVNTPGKTSNSRYDSGWTSPEVLPPQKAPYGTQSKDNHVSEMIVLSDNTKVYSTTETPANESSTIDLNTLKQEMLVNGDVQTSTPQVQAQPQNINITVNIPETEKTYTNTFYSETKTVEVVPQPKVAKEGPKAEPKSEAKKPVVKEVKTVTKTTSTIKSAPKTEEPAKVTQFWVQVAAYGNKKGAENARSILDDNKIPADIFTFKDNKDTLFYRVRVGPYTTKSEAEYWRTRIIQINEFSKAESFVTSTTN